MKNLSERVFIISASVIFGAVMASLAICLILNRVATYSYLTQKMTMSSPEVWPHAEPVPLRVPPGYQNLYSRMDERVDRGDLGLMMLDTESGKKRILWVSGGLEKWLLEEHPRFIVVLGEKPSVLPEEKLSTLLCANSQGKEYEVYVLGRRNKFNLEDWREVLARDCDCATLTEKPSE